MNVLDRIVAAVSPRAGLRRARHRLALQAVRAYEAGRITPRTQRWRAPDSGANAEIGPALSRLRARARQMVRDNPYAARIVSVLAAHQVGCGIRPRPNTGDPALDRQALALWESWARRCDAAGMHDFYGLQLLAARARAESGEALVRFVRPGPAEMRRLGLPVPLMLDVMEGDFLDVAKNEARADGTRVVQGVELDARGRRARYWLLREHPGDGLALGSATADPVPAADVLHIFRALRPGQVRGVPDLAPALLRLRQLEDYEDAALEAAKVQATLAVFLQTMDATDLPGSPADRDPIELMPGLVAELPPGTEPKFLQPSGAGAFEPFALHTLMAAAAGAGVTYDQATGDLRQANYSSLRAGKIEFRRMIEQDQWLLFIPRLCQPVWDAFVQAAVVAGALPPREGGYPVEWTPPRFEMIDPTKEIPAWRDGVRAGMMPWTEAVSELGYDPTWVADEIARSNAMWDDRGLVLDSDPRRTNQAGGAQDARQNAAVEIAATGAALPTDPPDTEEE